MVERIRDALVAEEIAAQAGTDTTPPLFLSETLQPVIFGPQRPPLAASQYFPGCVGSFVAGVALNTSQFGILVDGTNVPVIVRVNSIVIQNITGGALSFEILRANGDGFSATAAIPGYIDAGNPANTGVRHIVRSNTVTSQGDRMALVGVGANTNETFLGPWILNNGALVVACTTVNTSIQIYMNYELWAAIRRQTSGG